MARSGRWEMSTDVARRVALAAQGFADPPPAGVVDRRHMARVMKRMQVVQLDSVPVVIRTQYLPFHSRLGPYTTSLFDDVAYRSGRWFEAWAHEASLLPVETEPLFRWAKESARQGNTWKNLAKMGAEKPRYVADILEEVRRAGSVVARDLEEPVPKPTSSGPHDGWWNRSDTKNALDWLFRIGEVGVRRSGNFAKVYSPIDQIVPADILALATPTPEDAQRQLCAKAVRSLGVGTATDVADYFRLPIRKVRLRLDELVEEGQVVAACVAGWGQPGFADPEARIPRSLTTATVLSPFDPVVWNRDRARRLFDFDYKLEIYTPAAKRRWGYYVLPVLHDTNIVGRLDVKTHRDKSRLEVKASYLESGREESMESIAHSVRALASLVGAKDIDVVNRGNISAELRQSLV